MIRVVAAIIKDEFGRFLIGKRKHTDKHFPSKWDFPGGKVKEGETFLEALRRELREELYLGKVNVKIYPIWEGEHPEFPYCYIEFYEVVNFEGVPAMLEYDGLMWCTKDEILARTDLINELMKTVLNLL